MNHGQMGREAPAAASSAKRAKNPTEEAPGRNGITIKKKRTARKKAFVGLVVVLLLLAIGVERGLLSFDTQPAEANAQVTAKSATPPPSLVPLLTVFWHIGRPVWRKISRQSEIVRSQLKELEQLSMWQQAGGRVRFVNATSAFLEPSLQARLTNFSLKIVPLPNPAPELYPELQTNNYFEFPTLTALHSHCLREKKAGRDKLTYVLYIHTKNLDGWRREMQTAILGNSSCLACLKADASKVACGTRFSDQLGWAHFSGNFWMARCSHIVQLNGSFGSQYMERFPDIGDQSLPPRGRWYAEYWLLNDNYHSARTAIPPRAHTVEMKSRVCIV